MMKFATIWSSIASRFDAFIPFTNVATNATSATPIISAAAVAAVRPGLRTELRRASAPGGAADPPRRQPDDGGERPDELRRDHRDPDEQQEHAAGDRQEPLRRVDVVGEHRVAEQEQREGDQHERDVRREAVRAALRQLRALADGRDRRDARRADRGEEPGDHGDERPDEERDDDRPRREDRVRVGQPEPERAGTAPRAPWRARRPRASPMSGREEPDHERLEQHRPQHLTPRGAEGPERRELPRALRDGDRERVEDHERADEERDPGEGEQEVAEEGRELADLVLGVLRLLHAGLHLGVGRQERLDVGDELLRGRSLRCRDGDRVVLPLAVEERLRGRDVEDRERRGPDRLDVAVLRDPDDLEVLLRLERRDLDRSRRARSPRGRPCRRRRRPRRRPRASAPRAG